MKTAISTRVYGVRSVWGVILVGVLLISTSLSIRSSAQSNSAAGSSQSAGNTGNTSAEQSGAEPDEDFSPHITGDDDGGLPPETNLETGNLLTVLETPLRWGRLSLLSFTADEGYDTNPAFRPVPLGAALTAISGLVAYSPQVSGWRMDFQYHPFIWVSSRQTVTSFAAASADMRTAGRVGNTWRWSFADRLKYSPTHATEQEQGFVVDPSGGFTIGNAFLSNGRNLLVNAAGAALTDRYSENSSFTFHEDLEVNRLGSYIGTLSSDGIPVQTALASDSGVTWRDHYSPRNTISLHYVFRTQVSTGTTTESLRTNTASIGWGRKLTPGLGLSVAAGPAWSIYGQPRTVSSHTRTTLHASVGLSKEFRGGIAVLAFNRSDSFSGVISDSFYNRYDLAVHWQIGVRLSCSVSASYVQQQFLSARNAHGETASAETRYLLNRNWAVFAQVRYFRSDVYGRIHAPETNAILGFRWAWAPDEP